MIEDIIEVFQSESEPSSRHKDKLIEKTMDMTRNKCDNDVMVDICERIEVLNKKLKETKHLHSGSSGNPKFGSIRRHSRVNHPGSLDSVNNLVEKDDSDITDLEDEFQNK